MKQYEEKTTPLHAEPSVAKRVVMRARGSKLQLAAVAATISGLMLLPEFAQAIGAGGAFAIAIANLLKARHE